MACEIVHAPLPSMLLVILLEALVERKRTLPSALWVSFFCTRFALHVFAFHDVTLAEVCFLLRLLTVSHCHHIARLLFFVSAFRSAFVLIVLTFASWLYTRHRKSKKGTYPIKILGTVPRGFKDFGAPHIEHALISALLPKLPVATIILLLEHIAIAKCRSIKKVPCSLCLMLV